MMGNTTVLQVVFVCEGNQNEIAEWYSLSYRN